MLLGKIPLHIRTRPLPKNGDRDELLSPFLEIIEETIAKTSQHLSRMQSNTQAAAMMMKREIGREQKDSFGKSRVDNSRARRNV